MPAANTTSSTRLNLVLSPIVFLPLPGFYAKYYPSDSPSMNLAAWLARAARSEPHRPAVFHGADAWADYGVLAGRVARLAAGLRARGLVPGDRVAIVMKNAPEYLEALYAI